MSTSTGNPFVNALAGHVWPDNRHQFDIFFDDDGRGGQWFAAEKSTFMAAANTWAAVADISFREVTDPREGDLFEWKETNQTWIDERKTPPLADHSWPSGYTKGRYNTSDSGWGLAPVVGGLFFGTFVHELGHGLGLDHPFQDKGQDTINFPDSGAAKLDQILYSIMSYTLDNEADSDAFGRVSSPMAFDIAAIQELYGARLGVAGGDDTYLLRDYEGIGTYYRCIWDTGGTDRIVYNGGNRALIDLRPATLRNEAGGGGWLSTVFLPDGVTRIHGGYTIAGDWKNVLPSVGAQDGVVIENAFGGSGDDTLIGNDADNVLHGRGGADDLRGGFGRDTASYITAFDGVTAVLALRRGTAGDALGDTYVSIEDLEGSDNNDTLIGDSDPNGLYGRRGDDRLEGRDSYDTLDGGAGNDTLVGGEGGDSLNGGSGTDLVSYATAPTRVVADLLYPFYNQGDANGDTYVSVEDIEGSNGPDILNGDHRANRISGGWGQDTIAGRGGADSLVGGEMGDSLLGEAGADTLVGGNDGDTLDGSSPIASDNSADLLVGGFGDDVYFVDNDVDRVREDPGRGYDRVFARGSFTLHLRLAAVEELRALDPAGTDAISLAGSQTDNLIVGNAGDNAIDGRTGADTMIGLAGDDTFVVDDPGDVVVEADEPGTDLVRSSVTFSLEAIFAEHLTLTGTANVDGRGNSLNNSLGGNIGDNVIWGFQGRDTIHGNSGNDTLTGGDGNDIIFGDAHDDQLFGDAANDTIYGGTGFDELFGGDGNDLLRGGPDADTLLGGNDVDVADYRLSPAGISVNLATGLGFGGEASGDVLDGIERVYGSAQADSIAGDGGANLLLGNNGFDTLDGGAGPDTLMGGAGNDLFYVDSGDRVDGGAGYDHVAAVAATAKAGFAFTLTDAMSVELIQGHDGNDRIDASAMTTTISIYTHGGADTVLGGSGDDAVQAFAGDDYLDGGLGFDQLNGGEGNDTMIGGGGPANPPFGDWLYAGPGDDLLFGSGYGAVVGEGGNDTMTGGIRDIMNGGDGNDSITGTAGFQQILPGTGNDTILGGADGDRFDFYDAWGDDRILDYEPGRDKIGLFGVTGLDLFSQLSLTDGPDGVVIGFAGNTLLLAGLTKDQLAETDFLL